MARDSLDFVEFVMDVEQQFGFNISDNDAERLGSPRQSVTSTG